LELSWKDLFNFNAALVHFDLPYEMAYPLATLKAFGPAGVDGFSFGQLLLGMQSGGVGATFGLGLIAGGIYLMGKGIVRWEISLSFLAGVFITALIFFAADSTRFAPPLFHLLTGYTLLGAFFLAPEDSSSPVNFIPMMVYGAGAGILTVLIRNIGAYIDGVVLAVLIMNCVNPLLDKIRPKALGKAVQDA
jgi:electron transport complex protein RnfD